MPMKQRGFTLIMVLAILMVLSLVVMAAFEQAQWVKRGNYYVWCQVKMQDRLWQQLVVAEQQLPERTRTQQCFALYSVRNDYFFMPSTVSLGCAYKLVDEDVHVIYESISETPCDDFFRITLQGQLRSSQQKMVLQAVEALPKRGKNTDMERKCTKNNGRQSWLLQ